MNEPRGLLELVPHGDPRAYLRLAEVQELQAVEAVESHQRPVHLLRSGHGHRSATIAYESAALAAGRFPAGGSPPPMAHT